jgi:hypothetical protein
MNIGFFQINIRFFQMNIGLCQMNIGFNQMNTSFHLIFGINSTTFFLKNLKVLKGFPHFIQKLKKPKILVRPSGLGGQGLQV